MNRKPTGISGSVSIGTEKDGTPLHRYEPFEFPADKRECEVFIAKVFLEAMAKSPALDGTKLQMSKLNQNPEQGLDFSVVVNGIAAELELTEVAPLTGPYKNTPPMYTVGDYVAWVMAKIEEKAGKYRSAKSTTPIYLLTYITHGPFMPWRGAVDSVRYHLRRLPDCPFAAVFFHAPMFPNEPVTWLYPADTPRGFHPDKVANNVEVSIDMASATPRKRDDGAVEFMFKVPNPLKRR